MKKLLISLVLLVPLLAGCANLDTMVTINDDESASVASSLSYNGNLSDKVSNPDKFVAAINDISERFKEEGFEIIKNSDDKLSTLTLVDSVKDLSKEDIDLSGLGFISRLPDEKFIVVKKNFLITSYNIDCVYYDGLSRKYFMKVVKSHEKKALATKNAINPEYFHKYADPDDFVAVPVDSEDFVSNLDDETKKAMKNLIEESKQAKEAEKKKVKQFVNSFSIKVPTIASYNNADSVKGNVYTWELKENEKTSIKLQYVKYSGWGIAFIILTGILILVLIAARIVRHETNKRIDNIKNIV